MEQPAAWDPERARAIISGLAGIEGPMLPVLHALQTAFGCVPEQALPLVADALNVSRAEVHGVVSFYQHFRREPGGRHVLRLCRAEACQSVGAEAVAEAALSRLGVAWHGTTPDGAMTLEPVFCLGLCACGPAALLDEQPLARLTPERIGALLETAR